MNQSQLETGASAHGSVPEPLQRWGAFEQLQRVGQGSFGEVYRAFDPTLQRYVALKLLLPSERNREDETVALLREARAMARLRHPNVVPIYGVDRHEGRIGFWSDFVHGQTLAQFVAAHGALSAREATLIGIDVCRALTEANPALAVLLVSADEHPDRSADDCGAVAFLAKQRLVSADLGGLLRGGAESRPADV